MSSKSISDELDRVLFKLRTTHEIEHNDNQWTTEFVYPLDDARQAILNLIADEYAQLLDSQIIKPEYHNAIVTKIKELRGKYGKT